MHIFAFFCVLPSRTFTAYWFTHRATIADFSFFTGKKFNPQTDLISTSTKSLLLRLYCPTFTLIAAIPALSLVAATFKLWKTTTCCSQQFTQQIIF